MTPAVVWQPVCRGGAGPWLQRLMRHVDIKTTLAFYTNVVNVLDDAILKA